jgi:hypothetical protein
MSDRLERAVEHLLAKRAMLEAMASSIRTLVLGSSYGEHGFDPAFVAGSFNLCFRLQDLRHSCALYERISPTLPALQTVVVFYAIGSRSNYAEHIRGQGEVCAAMDQVFGLEIPYRVTEVIEHRERLRGRRFDEVIAPDERQGFMPQLLADIDRGNVPGAVRAGEHLKLSRRRDGDLSLLRLLVLTRRRGHRVVVVTPPARSDYVQAVGGASRTVFRDLARLLFRDPHGAKVQWINAFDSGEFDDVDFVDSDHLAPLGAGTRRLSLRIGHAVRIP